MADTTQTTCVNLAKCGCYAFANENIGHGEREMQGHWDVVVPFACNLLMGFAGKTDMWELQSVFASKPLLLEQGRYDDLVSVDYFYRNARKVKNTYQATVYLWDFLYVLGLSPYFFSNAFINPFVEPYPTSAATFETESSVLHISSFA